MDDNEVNKVIAEYMGKAGMEKHHINGQYKQTPFGPRMEYDIEERPIEYTKSLDALVPVWEKLGSRMVILRTGTGTATIVHKRGSKLKDGYSGPIDSTSRIRTIKRAAAHSTAKAIKELSNG